MTTARDPLEQLFGTLFLAHPWHGLDPGDPAHSVLAFVEITPKDSLKYELDKPSGHLRVDRPQRYSSQTPTPYGFIPRTWCGKRVGARSAERLKLEKIEGDHDPIDICILTENEVAHGVLCRVRPIGGLRVLDGNEADDKIVAVLEKDLAYGHVRDLAEVPPAILKRLEHYFLTYKQLPESGPREVKVAETYGRDEAIATIRLALEDYREHYGTLEARFEALRKIMSAAR